MCTAMPMLTRADTASQPIKARASPAYLHTRKRSRTLASKDGRFKPRYPNTFATCSSVRRTNTTLRVRTCKNADACRRPTCTAKDADDAQGALPTRYTNRGWPSNSPIPSYQHTSPANLFAQCRHERRRRRVFSAETREQAAFVVS